MNKIWKFIIWAWVDLFPKDLETEESEKATQFNLDLESLRLQGEVDGKKMTFLGENIQKVGALVI